MKKDGFISTALIYTFFILFLVLMVFLLNSYSSTKFLTDTHKNDIEEELYELSSADINLYIYTWNNNDKEYEYRNFIPTTGYRENVSYCKNKSTMTFNEGEISVSAKEKDYCYAYFDEVGGNITSPTITASDGKASGAWRKNAVTLSFSGSRVINYEGSIVYYYGRNINSMTESGTSTISPSDEGNYTYYVKACSSINLNLCSDIIRYQVNIDKTAPSCSIDGNTSSWTTSKTLTQDGSDSGEGTVYYSWDNKNSYSTTKSNKTVTANGTYTLYVKDGLGNETSCSTNVSTIKNN